ncbi:MAG TPA: hypothetical protein VHZ95_08615 [Polyangiales bacterium]|nr:hypothetical protein [Polyangiales bacterium]
MIEIFESHEAERLLARTPASPEQAAALRYLAEFLRGGPRSLIEAVDLPRLVVAVESELVPVVVNDGRERLCYFLSPRVHYVDYMREELAKIRGNREAAILAYLVALLGRVSAPLGFNRCVSVNNWLFTTSPSLQLTAAGLTALTRALAERFPFPIVVRGIDLRDDAARRTFERAGYAFVVNRPVFELDTTRIDKLASSQRAYIKRDQLALDRSGLRVVVDDPLPGDDAARVAALYRGLYLEKHSRFNARYTPAYFRLAADSGIERVVTLRDEAGTIVAFMTLRPERDRLVLALVGYDLARQAAGLPLYRGIFAAALRIAREEQRICFMSTGNAEFKRRRGGIEWLEYEAVYARHLSLPRRAPWQMFKSTFDLAIGKLDTSQI